MGKLIYESHLFRFKPDNRDEIALAKKAFLKLEPQTLQWTTRKIEKAVMLRRFADKSAEQKFKKYFITVSQTPEHIRYPRGQVAKDFQLESACHALTYSPAYIADEAGLGKTITSVLCMNTRPLKTLVICPPYLKYNWFDEIQKWSTRELLATIIEKSKDPLKIFAYSDVVILPDSLLASAQLRSKLYGLGFGWCFIDEAHRYKDENAQRTKALFKILEDVKYPVFLSGTPMPNRPLELYPVLANAAHSVIDGMSLNAYGQKYCAGKLVSRFDGRKQIQNWDFRGASNLKELRFKLTHQFMIRHLKKDVLKELEPKTRQLIFLDQPKKLEHFEQKHLSNLSLSDLMGEECELGDIATYRKECGLAKLPQAVTYLKDQLESSHDPLVVFAHHIDVVEGLAEALKAYRPVTIRGGMTAAQKQARVKHFQNLKQCRLIIGNIDSMGVGLTLTRSKRVVFVEPSWVPGMNEQAEDRVHRITQSEPVTIQYLVMRASLDERMLRATMDKQKAITQVMGDLK